MRALLVTILALAVTAPTAEAARPGPEKPANLQALLLPFQGRTEQIVFDTSTQRLSASVHALVRGARPGTRYRFALSRRGCKASPKLVGRGFGAFTAKTANIEVENDETHFVGRKRLRRARSVVLLDADGVAACGLLATTYGRGGFRSLASLAPTGRSGVDALGITRERRGRLRVKAIVNCEQQSTCQLLMEGEGIFYFAPEACGQPAAPGKYSVTFGPDVAEVRGYVLELEDVMVSSVRNPVTKQTLSWRIAVGDEELACGTPLG
jgi:hypothetical protein